MIKNTGNIILKRKLQVTPVQSRIGLLPFLLIMIQNISNGALQILLGCVNCFPVCRNGKVFTINTKSGGGSLNNKVHFLLFHFIIVYRTVIASILPASISY